MGKWIKRPGAEAEHVTQGRIVETCGATKLAARAHAEYCGPVWKWAGLLWVIYQDRPLEVIHVNGKNYEELI